MEGGDPTPVNGFAIPFVEPPRLQVESPGRNKEDNEAGNLSDDPIRVIQLETAALRRECSDMQRTIDSTTFDSRQSLILRSSESENSRPQFDTEALDDMKNDLTVHIEYIERRMSNLLTEKESEAANSLKEYCEFTLVLEKLDLEAEKMKVALKEKEDALSLFFKDLKTLLKKQVAKVVFAREKKSLISFEQRQQLLRDKCVKHQAVVREIGELRTKMGERWKEIHELLSGYDDLMKTILPDDRDDHNHIPQYYRQVAEFPWVLGVIVVATIVVTVALQTAVSSSHSGLND